MGERPQYHLMMKVQHSTQPWSRVGVAWATERGFSIKLNPGVVLNWKDFDGSCTLGLFPNDDEKTRQETPQVNRNVENKSGVRHSDSGRSDDDEIPF